MRSRAAVALAAVVVSTLLTGAPTSAGAAGAITVVETNGRVLVTVPASPDAPGYALTFGEARFGFTVLREGAVVLRTNTGGPGMQIVQDGRWVRPTSLTAWTWDGTTLRLRYLLQGTAGTAVLADVTPTADRFPIAWSLSCCGRPSTFRWSFDRAASGHWYGQGEAAGPAPSPYGGQPWPLDHGSRDNSMNPANYLMTDPFWFTQDGTGLWVDTQQSMHAKIDARVARMDVVRAGAVTTTFFVEADAAAVYADHMAAVGYPQRIGATRREFRQPVWNTWAQFYTGVNQAKVLRYARGLRAHGLDGHAVQIDDGWMAHYGDLTFDPAKFPHPRAMSQGLRRLGYGLGLWTTLWINTDSANFDYAARHHYFLPSKTDPSQPCMAHWWNGVAGIVDLANPAARSWYVARLHWLQKTYGVGGFKFDTRFFDPRCGTTHGKTAADYLKLGAKLVGRFDQEGVGVRISWGSQPYGFVTREVDKCTDPASLRAAVQQDLAISTIGYPFVETDMIGGSNGCPPPSDRVLVQWARTASLMPLMYSSTSPVGRVVNPDSGAAHTYTSQTIAAYRTAIRVHERLAPYVWSLAHRATRTGDPIMQPVFFRYPAEARAYTTHEWLLGNDVLAAPNLLDGAGLYFPAGTWIDPSNGHRLQGPAYVTDAAPGYGAFVLAGRPDTHALVRALRIT